MIKRVPFHQDNRSSVRAVRTSSYDQPDAAALPHAGWTYTGVMVRALLLVIGGFAVGLATGWLLREPGELARAARRAPAPPKRPVPRDAPASAPHIASGTAEATDAVAALYRKRMRKRIDPRLLEILLEERRRTQQRSIENTVARAIEYERQRDLYGQIHAGSMLLQTRNGTTTPMPREPNRVRKAPLDIGITLRDRESHVEGGGVIPLGKVLVVEKAVLNAGFEFQARGNRGSLKLRLGRGLSWRNVASGFRGTFQGRAFFRPGQERDLSVEARGGVASLELEGRLVTPEEVQQIGAAPFRWIPEGSAGFLLGDAPITLQVVADHGGGNPRRVGIDGSHNGRFDARELRSIWSETAVLAELRDSFVHYEGIGLVPPGKAFVLTRVEYRGRLDPKQGRHSDFVIRADGRELFKTNAKLDARPQGVWQGSVKISPGRESTVSLELSYFGIGEARFFGDLVDE